jgi:hypothetical protein
MCIPFIILLEIVMTGCDWVDGPLTASVCQSWVVDKPKLSWVSTKEVIRLFEEPGVVLLRLMEFEDNLARPHESKR